MKNFPDFNLERLSNLERRVSCGQLDRRSFLRLAGALGATAALASSLAEKSLAAGLPVRSDSITDSYDYIVVGAGSAGCVVASALSASGSNRVLLIEAGGTDVERPNIVSPFAWPKNQGTDVDWQYMTTPQRYAANRRIRFPRGKVIGGSSSINALIWVWGEKSDFDNWEAAGCKGWSFADLEPVFRSIETCRRPTSAGNRGRVGPMQVGPLSVSSTLDEAFFESCRQNGMKILPNIGAPIKEGAGSMDLSVMDDKRFSVVQGYLLPALSRDNLTLLTDVTVERLLFSGTQCTGVRCRIDGQTKDVLAAKETILSAGAVDSPRLLLVSGVGPANELSALGIKTVVDLPGVGKNLQDHPALDVFVAETKEPTPTGARLDCQAFFKSRNDITTVDSQILFVPVISPPHPLPPNAGYMMKLGLMRPQSRGSITLTSAEPGAPLFIDPQYLSVGADSEALVSGAQRCIDIGLSEGFSAYRKRNFNLLPQGRAAIAEYASQHMESYWHPTSTCAMGISAQSVVDPALSVNGVTRLRIADASVMPTITTGNTNAPSIVIGEMAGRLILRDGLR